jgi:hypothetical protein
MKYATGLAGISLLYALTCACGQDQSKGSSSNVPDSSSYAKGSFGYDRNFLQSHTNHLLELADASGQSKVLVSADFQGRVMSSTAGGDNGISFGWINYDLIGANKKKPHFNPYGGEERFWVGPEGGQYSVYFAKGDSFNLAHWQVPAVIDTVPYEITRATKNEASFRKTARLVNYSGTVLDFEINRTIRLLSRDSLEKKLGVRIADSLRWVSFESVNQIRNTGQKDWTEKGGLLSIWLLSMMTPTDQTKVLIPFRGMPDARRHITDNYFGTIPAQRLEVKDSILYFRCDGRFRSKIGIAPQIARPIAASFDFKRNVLTVLYPEIHPLARYVNSKWEIQKNPYQGDVINSYNDGPLQDGTQLGPFYEIESSSPALSLRPGETSQYTQVISHFQGSYQALRQLAMELLGTDIDDAAKW